MRDSAVTGRTVCLDAAAIRGCVTSEDLRQAVLAKLQLPAGGVSACLELDGKALPIDKPLDLGIATAKSPIMLTLSSQGLLGGSDKGGSNEEVNPDQGSDDGDKGEGDFDDAGFFLEADAQEEQTPLGQI